MTKEQIIQNIKTRISAIESYHPEEYALNKGILFELKDLLSMIEKDEPSLPSNFDEEAEKMYPMTTTPPTPIEVAAYYNAAQQKLRDAFKAGAEWMTRQGVNIRGKVLPGTHGNSYIESDWFDKGYEGLSWNDEVILTIRKKQ